MIDSNFFFFFEIPIKTMLKLIKKNMQIGIDNDYLAGNLQDYEYFPKNFKLIVIDISKQKELQNLSNTQKRYFLENVE